MPEQKNSLQDKLSRSSEITITVTGRKSGRTISNPVWFALDGDKLYLLPVHGSDTEWYKNVLKNPVIRINAGGAVGEFRAAPINRSQRSDIRGREIPREVRRGRREEVLFQARRRHLGPGELIVHLHDRRVKMLDTSPTERLS